MEMSAPEVVLLGRMPYRPRLAGLPPSIRRVPRTRSPNVRAGPGTGTQAPAHMAADQLPAVTAGQHRMAERALF